MMVGIKDESLNDWLFGCELVPLDKFLDKRGYLVPVWSQETASPQYVYYSITFVGQARDPDRWHVHENHIDRFVVVQGNLLFAVSDGKTTARIALSGRDPKMLIIPPGVYHCLINRWDKDATLLNMPSQIYDPSDEGRVSFDALEASHPW